MNKRGFTLVELLAVVVVLAVVSIIAIPITINIIENARKGALEESAKGLMDAANNYYALHSKDVDGNYVDFSIVDGKQTSSEKLKYKGSIDNGYLRLVDAKTMALCIDDNKYFAVKNMDSNEITIDEGVCSGEYDEDLLGYVTVGSASYIGTRLNIKAYANKSALPSRGHEGDIAVITDTKITGYILSPVTPTDPKDGMVWVVLDNTSSNYIVTKTSVIGVGYVVQYSDNTWKLKDAYAYNDGWDQLTNFANSEYEWLFDYSGHYEEFIAPYSGYYTVELWGAQGGNYDTTWLGGKGAYTKGDIYLNNGETIYIYVGGAGQKATNGAGWNGGNVNNSYVSSYGTPGSGGATDVRTQPTSAPTTWNEIASLRTRIMVAAGGGSGTYYQNGGGAGAAGGGLIGYVGTTTNSSGVHYYGTPGTQTSGGANSYSNNVVGSFGVGGQSETSGGGGWYGGGGSYSYIPSGSSGSSYISGHTGCNSVDVNGLHTGSAVSYTGKYFINTKMIDGEGYNWTETKGLNIGMPSHSGSGLITGNEGNGYARISFKTFENLDTAAYQKKGADIQTVWNYPYLGYYQQFVAPKAGTYKFELWGAQGGNYDASWVGGKGAYTSGKIHLEKGEVFYIYVGSQGQKVTNGSGWNGGNINNSYLSSYGTPGSGGATDIRTIPTATVTTWNETASLRSRIMVAGAGGSGTYYGNGGGIGGAGGGLIGYSGVTSNTQGAHYYGSGGTQTAGGSNTYSNNAVGIFGIGGQSETSGGAGWYGGGGSYSYIPSGAGGSSYISGHLGCVGIAKNGDPLNTSTPILADSYSYTGYIFNTTIMIDGEGYKWTTEKGDLVQMPTHDGLTKMVGNEGNGYAKVTYIGK